jgi:osmotically inducible protein OsmC
MQSNHEQQEKYSMAIRTAEATWEGSSKDGKGKMSLGSGAFEGAYSHSSRFEEGKGTNPEELIGAAHAGCYSMALSSELGKIGLTPQLIHTRALVTLGKIGDKDRITLIHLDTEARVPGITPERFHEIAEATRTSCPVSAALASVPITLDAKLISDPLP